MVETFHNLTTKRIRKIHRPVIWNYSGSFQGKYRISVDSVELGSRREYDFRHFSPFFNVCGPLFIKDAGLQFMVRKTVYG